MKPLYLLRAASLLLGLLMSLSCSGAQQSPRYQNKEIDLTALPISSLYRQGTEAPVAQELDVRGIATAISADKGIWRLRVPFNLADWSATSSDIRLQYRGNAAAIRIYLNGNEFVSSGVVGQSESTEKQGLALIRATLPRDMLHSGRNEFELVFSNYHNNSDIIFRDVLIGPIESIQSQEFVMTAAPMIFLGGFVLFLFVNAALFFALERQPAFAVLTVLSLVSASLMLCEIYYWHGHASSVSWVDIHQLRWMLEIIVYAVLCLLLTVHLNFQNKWKIGGAFILAYALGIGFRVDVFLLSMLPVVLLVVAAVIKVPIDRKIIVSVLVLVVFNLVDEFNLIESQQWVYRSPMVTSFVFKLDNLGLFLFTLAMIFIGSQRVLGGVRALAAAEKKVHQLEYQLISKTIQPHFLMNTLMSLQQLVANKDPGAGLLIEALADEFASFSEFAKRKVINMSEEVGLCRSYLKIMSIQQRADHKLNVKGFDDQDMIPPAVIHSLVENGFTHGYKGKASGTFHLSKSTRDNKVVIKLQNNGSSDSGRQGAGLGQGHSYVQAQLENWLPGKWAFYSHASENGWENVIELDKEAYESSNC